MGDDDGELLRWDPVIPMMRAGAMRLPLSQNSTKTRYQTKKYNRCVFAKKSRQLYENMLSAQFRLLVLVEAARERGTPLLTRLNLVLYFVNVQRTYR